MKIELEQDEDFTYQFRWSARWEPKKRVVVFVLWRPCGLNPSRSREEMGSSAKAIVARAKAMDAGAVLAVYLEPLWVGAPTELFNRDRTVEAAAIEQNLRVANDSFREAQESGGVIIAAWSYLGEEEDRTSPMMAALRPFNKILYSVGSANLGPRDPTYLPSETQLEPFVPSVWR